MNSNTPYLLTARILEVLGLRRRRVVLVIDLEEAERTLIRETLRRNGYEVVETSDGPGAMAILTQRRVHLVLSDLATSENTGVETIRRMRRFFPDLKIIAMSGEIPAEVLQMSRLLGADAALPKPIDEELLVKTVRRLLAD